MMPVYKEVAKLPATPAAEQNRFCSLLLEEHSGEVTVYKVKSNLSCELPCAGAPSVSACFELTIHRAGTTAGTGAKTFLPQGGGIPPPCRDMSDLL